MVFRRCFYSFCEENSILGCFSKKCEGNLCILRFFWQKREKGIDIRT